MSSSCFSFCMLRVSFCDSASSSASAVSDWQSTFLAQQHSLRIRRSEVRFQSEMGQAPCALTFVFHVPLAVHFFFGGSFLLTSIIRCFRGDLAHLPDLPQSVSAGKEPQVLEPALSLATCGFDNRQELQLHRQEELERFGKHWKCERWENGEIGSDEH